ncbi:MAG TPA: dihydropteroate synthase [Myxococcales bacterium]|nr:dihydropteroate synthase [Myxococcales bacterium]HIL80854.1 dihydropteroate synthase [Myxococcales bacterium]
MGHSLVFPPERVTIVGVLNVTPDSFSDGGLLLEESGAVSEDLVLRTAAKLVESGAHVLDVGGESTRPGAVEISVEEEIERTARAVEIVVRELGIPVSIDTRRAAVARAGLGAGAQIVNDVSGLSHEGAMAEVVAEADAVLILGHIRGTPATMQVDPHYDDVLVEVANELEESVRLARKSGVPDCNLVVDPGIGFGKRLEDNLQLTAHLGWLRGRLGLPVMVGASRKGFLGSITGDPVGDRDVASHAVCAIAAFSGVDAVRVHDVAGARRAVQVGRAMGESRRKELA